MSVIIALVMITTIVQVVVCHFTAWWILAVICRAAFCMRIIGATFKIRSLAIGEGVAFAMCLLFYALFKKNAMPWMRIGLYLLMSLFVLGLELLDTVMYVYDIEDYTEE